MSRDDATLLDVAEAARHAVAFARGVRDAEAFRNDILIRSAVLHQVTVLGEAVKRLSSEFRARHSEVPWKQMAGMRDRLIHGYDRVDVEQVWRAVTVDLPEVIRHIEPLLPREPGAE